MPFFKVWHRLCESFITVSLVVNNRVIVQQRDIVFDVPLLIFYFKISSTGQWSDPNISVCILESSSLSFRFSLATK